MPWVSFPGNISVINVIYLEYMTPNEFLGYRDSDIFILTGCGHIGTNTEIGFTNKKSIIFLQGIPGRT